MTRKGKGVLHLTILIYPSEDNPRRFVAHCLELDIVAVESNKPRAVFLLKDLVIDLLNTAMEDKTLDQVFTPAPAKYWTMLLHAERYTPNEKVRRHRINALPLIGVDYAWAGAS